MDELDSLLAPQGDELDSLLGSTAPAAGIRPKEQGGFTAAAKQAVGAGIRGAGQALADVGFSQDNAVKQYGQEVIDANPTVVKGFGDIVDKPLTTVKEAVGNAAGSVGGMLGVRALGQGITAAAPLTGPAAPFVAGAGQLISWGGPLVAAALPSYGGIRGRQIEKDPTAVGDTASKLKAAAGAATIGALETALGPEAMLLKAASAKSLAPLAGKLAVGTSLPKAIGVGALKGAAVEGAEELVQNPIEQIASGDDPLAAENLKDTAFGGAMGAIGGGVFGGALGPTQRTKSDPVKDKVQKDLLEKMVPDSTVEVKDGQATIQTDNTTITTSVDQAAKVAATLGKKAADPVSGQELADALGIEVEGTVQEAPPAVEELPVRASMPTSTNLKIGEEVWSYRPPEGMTKENVEAATAGLAPAEKLNWFEANNATTFRNKIIEGELREAQNATATQAQSDPAQQGGDTLAAAAPDLGGAETLRVQGQGTGENQGAQATTAPSRPAALSREIAAAKASAAQPETETITPAEDTPVGSNMAGEPLYERADDSRYRMRTDSPNSRPGGYPDFGGDLAPAASQETPAGEAQSVLSSAGEVQAPELQEPSINGQISLPGVVADVVAEKGKYMSIYGWTGDGTGKTRAALQTLRDYGKDIEVHDPGEVGTASRAYWDKMQSEGLVDFLVDDEGNTISVAQENNTPQASVGPSLADSRPPSGVPSQADSDIGAENVGSDILNSIQGLTNPLRISSTEAPKFTTKEEVDAYKEQLRAQGYDGVYLTDKQQGFAIDKPKRVTATPAEVESEVKSFLGRGYENLVRRGKLVIVRSQDDAKAAGIPLRSSDGTIAGAYNPKLKKIVLIAGNIKKGTGADILKHEGVHALLREDKVFMAQREKILKDVIALAKSSPSFAEAAKMVPDDTQVAVLAEELLAYWTQNPENHKHSLFKRIISAVKSALFRLGIPVGRLTESDLSRIFIGGVKAWSMQEETAPGEFAQDPEQLFSKVSDTLQAGKAKAEEMANAMLNPQSKFHNLALQYADKWLGVLPNSVIAQTFGKKIQQLVAIDKHSNELQSTRTKISDDAYDVHQKASEVAAKDKGGVEAFNNALLVGTFNQMLPWADQYSQDWGKGGKDETEIIKQARKEWKASGMQKSTGMDYMKAWKDSQDAWNAMGDKSKEQALIVIDELKKIRQRERDNLLGYIEQVSAEDPELRANLMARFDATFSNIKGIYVPLSRYGNFRLDYLTDKGQKVTEYYETVGERETGKLRAVSVGGTQIVEGVKTESTKTEVAIPSELVSQILARVRTEYLSGVDKDDEAAVADAEARAQDVITDLNQTFLRWLPDTAALKNSIHRKNVSGAGTDMLRSYLDYMLRHASSIAWMEVGRKLDADIQSLAAENRELAKAGDNVDLTMRGHLLNNTRRWLQAVRTEKVNPLASLVGKFSTAYYMTSPSTFLVQLTQLPALTLPNLSTRFGFGRASAALGRGFQQAFSKDYSKDAMLADKAVNDVYTAIHRRVTEKERTEARPVGTQWYTEAQKAEMIEKLKPKQKQLLMLREAVAMNLLDISAVHEAQAIAFGKEQTLAGKAMKYAMLPMQWGELGSRKAAALATFDLAMQKGQNFDTAMVEVKKTIDETLYSYAKEDKGYLLQGSIPRALLQFQTYRIRTALRLGLLLQQSLKGESPEIRKAAWQEFTGIAGMSAVLGGANGVVFGSLIFGVASMLGGDDDEPFDAKLAFSNWLKENLGETAGQAAMYGVPTLAGTNVSARIGMGDLFGSQSEPPSSLHGAGLAAWHAAHLLGPGYSVAESWVKGYDQIANKGNYMKGLEDASPKPLKDFLKSIRVATDGLKDGQGKKLIADENIDESSILMMALGFNPDEIAAAQTVNYTAKKLSTQVSARRGRLIRDAARAIIESEDTEGPLEATRKFNSSMPGFAVTGRDIKPAIRKLLLGELGATGVRERQVAQNFGVEVYAP